jgi:hypothetical protein
MQGAVGKKVSESLECHEEKCPRWEEDLEPECG